MREFREVRGEREERGFNLRLKKTKTVNVVEVVYVIFVRDTTSYELRVEFVHSSASARLV